jgi:hypothetical protein
LNLSCGFEWGNQYLWDQYSDQELLGYARTALNGEDWSVPGGAGAASVSFTGGNGEDYTDVAMTDLQYTVTPSAEGGTCYWTVRFTDTNGNITDTAKSGSGTYTIRPDGMGTLNYDGNSNYASGAGTWQIINLSGNAPS